MKTTQRDCKMSEPERERPVHLPGASFPRVSTQGTCLSQGTLAVLSDPHLPSNLVSSLLGKLSAHSHADAGLKLSVTQPACPSILSPVEGAQAWGATPPLAFVSSRHQSSPFLAGKPLLPL